MQSGWALHRGGTAASGFGHRVQVRRRAQRAAHRRRRRHDGRDEVGASALALASFEVAVRCGGAALPHFQLVRVHAQAHRAAGKAPLRTEVGEDLVQALGLCFEPDAGGTGHHQHPDVRVLGSAADDVRRRPEVLHPGVGAGAQEHGVDPDVLHRRACFKAHVLQRAFRGGLGVFVAEVSGRGHLGGQGHALAGLVPHVTNGSRVSASRSTSASNVASSSVRSVSQYSTAASQSAPWGACGRPCM